jgi:hypothetical protein
MLELILQKKINYPVDIAEVVDIEQTIYHSSTFVYRHKISWLITVYMSRFDGESTVIFIKCLKGKINSNE